MMHMLTSDTTGELYTMVARLANRKHAIEKCIVLQDERTGARREHLLRAGNSQVCSRQATAILIVVLFGSAPVRIRIVECRGTGHTKDGKSAVTPTYIIYENS